MADISSDIRYYKYRKLRLSLLILLPLLIINTFIQWNFIGTDLTITISICLSFIDIGIVGGILSRKHYDWILAFVILLMIGLIFYTIPLPYAKFINFYGAGGLAIVSLISSVLFIKRYRHVPFLRYIGFSSSLVLSLVGTGLIFKLRHWPYVGAMLYSGAIALIILLLAFIFILPGSNYVNWERTDRATFIKAIVIPIIFVFVTFSLMLVFPEIWNKIINSPLEPWNINIEPVVLFENSGL